MYECEQVVLPNKVIGLFRRLHVVARGVHKQPLMTIFSMISYSKMSSVLCINSKFCA
jgi:hypothetical protein